MNKTFTVQHQKRFVLMALIGGAIVAFSLQGRIDNIRAWTENAGSVPVLARWWLIALATLATLFFTPGLLRRLHNPAKDF